MSNPIVLVAEDTDSNYLLISMILKREYQVEWAHDGVEAVDMCKQLNPDIILMDIRMPNMDGLEATSKIREFNTTVPIIAVTAFAFDKDRLEAMKAGCNDFLTKPIMASVLKENIQKHLTAQ
jgi:CheY-like chemotaxis protein